MDPVGLTKLLEDGGPWALLAIALIAIGFLTKKIFAQQKTIEDGLKGQTVQLKEQNEKLIKLLEQSTEASVNQTVSNNQLREGILDLSRVVTDRAPQLQSMTERLDRILRGMKLD